MPNIPCPCSEAWYKLLDRIVAKRFAPGSARFVAAKVAVDSVVFGPAHIAAWFFWATVLQGGTTSEVHEKLERDLLPTFFAEMCFWPLVQGEQAGWGMPQVEVCRVETLPSRLQLPIRAGPAPAGGC